MATDPVSAAFNLPPLAVPHPPSSLGGPYPSIATSQPLPGFNELDPTAGFYPSTSAAPFPPPHTGQTPGLSYAPLAASAPAHFPGYPPTPYSSGPTPQPTLPPFLDPFNPNSHQQPPSFPPTHAQVDTSPGTAVAQLGLVPPIGGMRCYWTILSPTLEFTFLDPILEYHTGEWANKLVGTNLLDYVHPEDQAQLREDLMPSEEEDEVKGVEGGGVFGSVTRLRYSRLVRVLRLLGDAHPPSPPDAHTYAIDGDYLNLDLTTSWIAGDRKGKGKGKIPNGAVLAFFHAAEDKDAVRDNDVSNRTGWSNWCGNQVDLTPQQCADLVAALDRVAGPSFASPSPASNGTLPPPAHVFQILDGSGRAVVTYPRAEGSETESAYDVEQLAGLAREVMARPREAVASKTNCTRRYRSKHPVMKDGTLTTVESVVIPYGAITFACFQTGGVYLSTARKAGLSLITNGDFLGAAGPASAHDFSLEDVPQTPTVGSNGNGMKRGSTSTEGGENGTANGAPTVKQPSMSPPTKRFKPAPPPPGQPQQPLSGLSITTGGRLFRNSLDVDAITAGGISPTVASASAILGSFSADAHQHQQQHQPPPPHFPHPPNGNGVAQSPSGPSSYAAFYASQPPPQPPHQHPFSPFDPPQITYSQPHPSPPIYAQQQPPQHSPYPPAASPHPLSQSHGSYFAAVPPLPSPHHDPLAATSFPLSTPLPAYPQQSPAEQFSPPPPAATSSAEPSTSAPAHAHANAVVYPDPSQIPVPPPPPPGSASGKKPPKQRPDGPVFKPNVKACESCGTVNSPEWRKGPTGAKSLCNACGLRYARSVARQKKQAEAAANGAVVTKGKKKKSAKKAAADGSPSTSKAATSVPSPSQPAAIHTSLPGAYDLSAYARVSPKPYTPYTSTAPFPPTSFAQITSPLALSHAPFHSPLPSSTAGPYFPPVSAAMGYSAAPPTSGAYSTGPSFPIATHSPLPPPMAVSHAPPPLSIVTSYPDFSRPPYAPSLPASAVPSPHIGQHQSPVDAPNSAGGVPMYPSQSNGSQPGPSPYGYDWQQQQQQGGEQQHHGGEGAPQQ
ncbi:hypothetical protein JCM8097_003262 [Rhodosporidiobolus ruineniae]